MLWCFSIKYTINKRGGRNYSKEKVELGVPSVILHSLIIQFIYPSIHDYCWCWLWDDVVYKKTNLDLEQTWPENIFHKKVFSWSGNAKKSWQALIYLNKVTPTLIHFASLCFHYSTDKRNVPEYDLWKKKFHITKWDRYCL